MPANDTIVAIATAAGSGGIGVVRLSGTMAVRVAEDICNLELLNRHAHYATFRDDRNEIIDDGIVLRFSAPRSYTGEDVVELQAHGSPVLLQRLYSRCLGLGARAARPGEFTERAWRNHKLDLIQAEAVADLISASSEAAARAARRSLDGVFSRRTDALLADLTQLRVQVEAAIDFPEEEIDFLGDGQLLDRLCEVRRKLADLLAEAERGRRLRDGLHVVIVGPPNAGKSSLMNAMAGCERAIVTAHPGTTRDLVRETIQLDDLEVTLVDTAGLRDSSDSIEREGMRRAREELARADLVLAVIDATAAESQHLALASELAEQPNVLWLHNKVDLLETPASALAPGHRYLSALSGAGLVELRGELRRHAGAGADMQEGAFSARARHVDALRRVGEHLTMAAARLAVDRAGELAAEELRLAQGDLGEIKGATSSDELLGAIFGSFCVGK